MIYLIIVIFFTNINFVYANSIGESTGYKIPRFVSMKSNESNLRIGAAKDYPIILTYTTKNLPLEIIDEYQVWRKVEDINGNQGWMHESLFQGNRYGIIRTNHNQKAQILTKPKGNIIGKIGNRNIVKINKCFSLWCHITLGKHKGWVNKINIWGVYKDEDFNMPFYQFVVRLYWKII